jgi:hypothetical protein
MTLISISFSGTHGISKYYHKYVLSDWLNFSRHRSENIRLRERDTLRAITIWLIRHTCGYIYYILYAFKCSIFRIEREYIINVYSAPYKFIHSSRNETCDYNNLLLL